MGEDRKGRIADLLSNAKPEDSAPAPLAVNGDHNLNLIAMSGAKIVIRAPAKCPEPAIGRPPEKKTTWRAELEQLIWQRVWDLALTSDQFYELAAEKLHRPVSSLAKVSERNLGVLYEMMSSMRRPALE